MGAITTSELSELIQTVVGPVVDDEIAKRLFWPGQPANGILRERDLTTEGGLTASFPKYNTIEADDLTEGVDYNRLQALDPTAVSMTATEVGDQSLLTDPAKKALNTSTSAEQYVRDIVRNQTSGIMTKFDTDVMALFASLDAGVGTTGTALTNAKILSVVEDCGENDLPEPWVGFLHTKQWANLVSEAGTPFAAAAAAGAKAEEFYGRYYVGTFYGVDWYVSSRVPYANGTTDRCGAVISGAALGVVWAQMPKTTVWRVEERRAEVIQTVAMYAVGEVDGTMGFSITSSAS